MRRHLHIQTDLIGYILTTHLPCAWDLVLWVFVLPGLGRIRLSRVCFQGAVDRVRLRAQCCGGHLAFSRHVLWLRVLWHSVRRAAARHAWCGRGHLLLGLRGCRTAAWQFAGIRPLRSRVLLRDRRHAHRLTDDGPVLVSRTSLRTVPRQGDGGGRLGHLGGCKRPALHLRGYRRAVALTPVRGSGARGRAVAQPGRFEQRGWDGRRVRRRARLATYAPRGCPWLRKHILGVRGPVLTQRCQLLARGRRLDRPVREVR